MIKETKANLRFGALIVPVVLLIFIPMICLDLSIIFNDDMNIVAKLFCGIITLPICTIIPLFCIYHFANEFFALKMIGEYKFSIVKDTVTRTETVYNRRHEEYVAHFKNYGKFKITRTQYDLTSAKDEYYLVILNCNKKVLNAYPTVTNECKDVTE